MKFFSLRWKISGILVLSNLFLGLIIIFIVQISVTSSLEREVIERGRTIARDLSRYSTEMMLEGDVVGLRQILANALAFESVQYILVENGDRQIISDTFNGDIPKELTDRIISSEINNSNPQLVHLKGLDAECYDVVVGIEEGNLGFIRIGMKRSYILEKVKQTNTYIFLSIIIVTVLGIIIVYFISNKIIKPIITLANRATEISRGDLENKITIRTNDEINYMAEAVERLRESLNIALSRLNKNKSISI
jgi:HAMP domain-containing protein